jgi:hypothetical protein
MIALDKDEFEQINFAARPLEPRARSEFLAALVAALEHQPQRGPGAIYRVCRDLQRRFFDPPISTGSKYD